LEVEVKTLTLAQHKRPDCDRAYWALFIDGELLRSYISFGAAQDAFIYISKYMTDCNQ